MNSVQPLLQTHLRIGKYSPVNLGAYLILAFEELFDFLQTISAVNVMKNFNALKALLLAILIQPASGFTADIEVLIRNLEAGKGKVFASLCNKNSFMKTRCGFEVVRKVSDSSQTLLFNDVAEGEYAVSIFYDVNGNEKLDTSIFGIPRELTGVSNNATGKNGPPAFEDASFTVSGDQHVNFTIDLF